MGFWKNFKRETGRNTGKWISNKVLGKSGWATPRRHILDVEESTRGRGKKGKQTRKASVSVHASTSTDQKQAGATNEADMQLTKSTVDDIQSAAYMEEAISNAERNRIIENINAIKFNSQNVDILCEQLDELLVAYKTTRDDDLADAIRAKAKSGIFRLERHDKHLWANHYKKMFKSPHLKRAIITILVILGLFGFALLAKYLDGY